MTTLMIQGTTSDAGKSTVVQALHYLKETQHNKVSHIAALTRIEEDHFVWMDHRNKHKFWY